MKFPKKKEKAEAKANAKGPGWNRPALCSPSKRKIKEEKKGVVGRQAEPAHHHGPNQILQTHSHYSNVTRARVAEKKPGPVRVTDLEAWPPPAVYTLTWETSCSRFAWPSPGSEMREEHPRLPVWGCVLQPLP